jgi:hypothetical protein
MAMNVVHGADDTTRFVLGINRRYIIGQYGATP